MFNKIFLAVAVVMFLTVAGCALGPVPYCDSANPAPMSFCPGDVGGDGPSGDSGSGGGPGGDGHGDGGPGGDGQGDGGPGGGHSNGHGNNGEGKGHDGGHGGNGGGGNGR